MKIIFLTFIVTLVSLNIFAQDDDRKYLVKVGDIAPDFEMAMPGVETIKLSSLRGKVVMLQFTASWCGVCRKEMPFIESEIWQKHKDNPNFALYGIDRDEPAETVLAFAKKTGVTYPIGLDPKAGIFELYAEKDAGITRNVIIGKDGRIVMLTRLYDPEEFKQMVKVIDNLLAEE
ncbi:peroxiredoxin [Dysgonomonas alginatilytica]|uniref:Peroxiredoxin n=1 Tax=Dysgonomonas alginatilytica TaxID=1605892 RepID=A0A2V3PQM8_9BACT|nr:TlpA disulfide reductase family protein [Dysgonomonas alginatilytica]PXV64422.1 peroxiredoxin [Dysgonomonas alginatilytica]